MAREYTEDEMRRLFLEHVKAMVTYWAGPATIGMSLENRLSGLAFSILSAIDGCSIALPAFSLIPSPHPDDAEYHKSEGENWWSDTGECDLAGGLHELFHRTEVLPEIPPVPTLAVELMLAAVRGDEVSIKACTNWFQENNMGVEDVLRFLHPLFGRKCQ